MRRLVALALLTSIGCSPALFTPVESEDPEIERLKSRIEELEQRVLESEAERDYLKGQVAELEAAAEEQRNTERPQPRLDDGIGGERSAALEPIESADIPPPPRPSRERSTPPVANEPGPLPAAAQELYDSGYTLYHRGLYLDAETAFQQFLSANSSSELADNAHYWIGESRFARADFRGALSAFRETVQRFPQGNKVPDALLREADTLARLGDVDQARATYEEVMRRFPASAAAPSARERRDQLP